MMNRFVPAPILLIFLFACCGSDAATPLAVQETPLGNATDFDAVKAVTFSADSRHVVFLGTKGDKQFVVRDGVAGPAYDWILPDSLAGTMDLSRLGYVIQNGNDIAAVIDGQVVGHGYYAIGADRIAFSADGKHYAYKARRGSPAQTGDSIVVRDGAAGKPYVAAQPVPTFSPDGNHLLYVASPATQKTCLVIDEKKGPIFDGISAATASFSPDSQRNAYAAAQGGKVLAVVDGKPGPPHLRMLMPPIFSPDSAHVAYVAGTESQFALVFDGVEGPQFDSFTDGSVVFSPDGHHLAYAARKGKTWQLILDGKMQREFEAIAGASIVFSPDSAHLAYVAVTNNKRFIIVDGKEQSAAYDNVLWPGPVFSPNSNRLAFAGVLQGRVRVVLDGTTEGGSYDTIGQLAFSPDSKHLCYRAVNKKQNLVVIDGKESAPLDDATPVVYGPDGRHYAYAALHGDHATLVLDGIDAGKNYTDWLKGSVPSFDGANAVNFLMNRDRQFLQVRVAFEPQAPVTPSK